MDWEEKLTSHLREALKAQDKIRVNTLRLLLAAIKNRSKELKKDPLPDSEIIKVIRKEVKKRKEAITLYEKAGRKDLLEKEIQEKEILEDYLPSPLTREEVEELVERVIQETGAEGLKDMGKVMGKIMSEYGERVEGSVVSELVKKKLKE